MRAIVALPLEESEKLVGATRDWPDSWVTSGQGFTRRLGLVGSATYARALIYSIDYSETPIQFSKNLVITRLIQVVAPRAFNQIICVVEGNFTDKELEALRRPGLAETKKFFAAKLSLKLDDRNLVTGTAIREASVREAECRFGLLKVPSSNSAFAFEVTYSLLASGVAAERQLIETATEITRKPGILAIRARIAHGWLNNWLSTPASDSETLLTQVELLRDALRLETRRSEILRALKQPIRAVDFGAAAGLGIAGLTSSIVSLLVTAGIWQGDSVGISIGIVAIIAPVGGLVTWMITRK